MGEGTCVLLPGKEEPPARRHVDPHAPSDLCDHQGRELSTRHGQNERILGLDRSPLRRRDDSPFFCQRVAEPTVVAALCPRPKRLGRAVGEHVIELVSSSERRGKRESLQVAKGPGKPSCERANFDDRGNAGRILAPRDAKAHDLDVFHSELCDVHVGPTRTTRAASCYPDQA